MPLIETLVVVGLKALFGKAAAGAAVKTGVALAGKAMLVHDAVQAVGAISDAISTADAVTTVADAVSPLTTSASPLDSGALSFEGTPGSPDDLGQGAYPKPTGYS